ncbi:MAG: type II toxin-antitoxin system YafQ family toxin [Bergeyella sp.]
MYEIVTTKQFDKEVKKCIKRGYDISLLKEVMSILAETGTLPPKYKPHKLSGNYAGCWECHIKSDWLLIWQQNDTELILLFTNTGTHSDLF